jgi:hypothetical protein
MKITRVFLLALVVSALPRTWAQEVIPGLIPRFYAIEAATDLPISPEEAHELARRGEDISLLQPSESTNIWQPVPRSIPNEQLIKTDEAVQYIGELPSRSGQLRFSVMTADGRELIVMLSKKIHTNLLRRNLLARLGYNTQPMQWSPRLKVVFGDTIDRDLFKEEMKDKLLAGTERWVKSEADLTLEMQDVLVLTPEAKIYNLASGVMPAEVHQGRRLLRAPYVPLALVDTTESVNLMPWQAGRVVLNNLKLNHTQDLDTSYRTSWEDARWIGRRIAKLTRADWEEIVRKSFYPLAVEKILVEKIVARRNDLMRLLSLEQESKPLAFDPKVTLAPGLVDGEIVQEFFDGYASRFSYGDPESPFSASELGSFALSRAQSQLIDQGITQLNKLLGTNDQAMFAQKIEEIMLKQGPFYPTQAVVLPSFHGSVILSRDIVTGAYLGTSNKVQLVDNVGFMLDAGLMGAVVGLPLPLDFKAGARLSFQRVFSHVKPVLSLKKSMKEPYKNMYVPMLLKNIGHKIDRLNSVAEGEQQAQINSIVTELKSALAIGESFIITDSMVPSFFTEAELSVSSLMGLEENMLKVMARVQAERMLLTRFHLHRSDEDTIQLYQDYGKNLKLMLTLKLRSYVPILAVNGRWHQATAQTHFYPVSLRSRDVTVETLKALRQSIFALNHDALQDVVTPHKIEHEMEGAASTLQFLIFKSNRIGSDQSLNLTHAIGGEKKKIYRRYDASTNGTDSESYVIEAVNSLVSILTKSDVALSQVNTMNPGFTLGGKAKNKIFTSEYDGERLSTNFQRIMNGWRVTPNKMKGLLNQINREVGRPIFDPLTVINTNSILLYQISFTYTLAQEGTDRLLAVSVKELERLLKTYPLGAYEDYQIKEAAKAYHDGLKRIIRELRGSDPSKGMKLYHAWLKDLQQDMSVRGLEEMVGKDNIAYQGRIEGFRQGDENGDNPIFSHVYGELPLPLHTSPTQQVMSNWGILEGELLANWMMERAI